jgi:hypothetical protein
MWYLNKNHRQNPKANIGIILKDKHMWDPEFEKENPSDEDKASSIWGDPTLDPWTGRPIDDDSDE